MQLQLGPNLSSRQVNTDDTSEMMITDSNEDDDNDSNIDNDSNDNDSNSDSTNNYDGVQQRTVNKHALPVVQRLLLRDVSASAQELVRLGGILLHGQHRLCPA